MQYERNEMDFKRGTFRVRGDVIDVFPAETPSRRCASRCSTTRSRGMQLFDPLTGHLKRQKLGASPSSVQRTT
jgi:excinuclease ABC subunit B